MGLFTARKPRQYRRVSIYTDERREKLDRLVRETRQEMGEIPADEQDFTTNRFKGKFSRFTPRAQRHSEGGSRLIKPIMLIALIVLILLWHYLQTGNIHF